MSKRAKIMQPIQQQMYSKAHNDTDVTGLRRSPKIEFRQAQAPEITQVSKPQQLDTISKTVPIPIMTNPNHSMRPVDKKFFEQFGIGQQRKQPFELPLGILKPVAKPVKPQVSAFTPLAPKFKRHP